MHLHRIHDMILPYIIDVSPIPLCFFHICSRLYEIMPYRKIIPETLYSIELSSKNSYQCILSFILIMKSQIIMELMEFLQQYYLLKPYSLFALNHLYTSHNPIL